MPETGIGERSAEHCDQPHRTGMGRFIRGPAGAATKRPMMSASRLRGHHRDERIAVDRGPRLEIGASGPGRRPQPVAEPVTAVCGVAVLGGLAGIARVGQGGGGDRTRAGVVSVARLPVALRDCGGSLGENKCGNEGESELGQHCPLGTRSVIPHGVAAGPLGPMW